MSKSILTTIFLCFTIVVFGQKKNDRFNYFIKKTNNPKKINGKIDLNEWNDADSVSNFYQVLPMDTSMAKVRTEVKFSYDKKNLYLLFINYNYIKGNNIVESMKRDWNFGRNDNNLLFFDTFNDQTTGFSFGSNARGGQWDALMSNGSNMNLGWENKWKSEVGFDDDKWVWEAAIPFKTLRYNKEIKKWGLNFSRLDLKTTEKSAWAPVPRNFPTASLAFTGNMVWDSLPPSPGKNISLIPFFTAGSTKIFSPKDVNSNIGLGFDAKIGLTSSLNMDLTVLPDFSQVEVDVQQTNLDRFELLFPERRQFFIENGDIFNNFGNQNLRPFFSRRIGLKSPLNFAAKVSGKINNNWRIGAMNLITGRDNNDAQGSNYGIFSIQRKVFTRSFISAIYTDRQTIGKKLDSDKTISTRFNRTVGLEYNLASKDNKWVGKAFVFKTFMDSVNTNNTIIGGNIDRRTRKYTIDLSFESVDKDERGNEVGFILRNNYYKFSPSFEYNFFPKGGIVLSHGPTIFSNRYFNKSNNEAIENLSFISYRFLFRKQDVFNMWVARDYVKLLKAFDPTGYKGEKLAAGQEHTWGAWGTSFTSRPQRTFTYGYSSRYGGYYANGTRLRLDSDIGYRFQPYFQIGIRGSYNRLKFEEDAKLPIALKNTKHDLWLIGPRIDVTLSNKVFFTNFMQYNSQSNNFNINTRFQWRYSPASDIYLVYTDNYIADSFIVKNRALVFKFTYWWNV